MLYEAKHYNHAKNILVYTKLDQYWFSHYNYGRYISATERDETINDVHQQPCEFEEAPSVEPKHREESKLAIRIICLKGNKYQTCIFG